MDKLNRIPLTTQEQNVPDKPISGAAITEEVKKETTNTKQKDVNSTARRNLL